MKKSKLIYLIGAVILGVSVMLIAFLVLISNGVMDSRTNLVISSGSLEKVYDGTPLSGGGWELMSGKLNDGHTLRVTLSEARTDVGVSENKFTASVTDSDGAQVTDGYNIEMRTGELKVTARVIEIKTNSAVKEYDGTPLRADSNYNVVRGTVAPKHSLTVTVLGERTDAGISDNVFSASVTDENQADVTYNYKIDKIHGKLEVTKLPISIATPSYHKVYDATPLVLDEWYYASNTRVLPQHDIAVTVVGSQTDADVSKNSIGEVRITENGKSVTSNYAITYIEGDLIVTPRAIAIRSNSDEKEIYDGIPLTNDGFEYLSQILPLEHHTVTVKITGSQTEPGHSPNRIVEVLITDGARDVTFNYDIVLQEGVLKVWGEGEKAMEHVSPGTGNPDFDINESGKIGEDVLNDGAKDGIALSILSERSGKIYLRYMSFGDYNGKEWSAATPYQNAIDSKYSYNYLTGITLRNAGYKSESVSVRMYGNNYLLPYYLDTAPYNYTLQTNDVQNEGNTSDIYSAYYYSFDFEKAGLRASVPSDYAARQQSYYEFVLDNYRSIPTSTKNYMMGIITAQGFDKFGENVAGLVGAVASFVRSAAVYNPMYNPALDDADDIAVSFLSESNEGVCRHFATAATMLFRALDIPARYTVGYAADTVKDKWVDVNADKAHAWVEVYIEGMGWVQVEATGAGAVFDSDNGDGDGTDGDAIRIKPFDLYKPFVNGAVLNAENELQGLSKLTANGYSYSATVSGKQTELGIGYSTITSFILYNADGDDVTGSFSFVFDRGKLHLYMRVLTVSSETYSKQYDGKALTADADGFTVQGELITGHKIAEIKPTGSRTGAGSSENSCLLRITDEGGADVTFMYKIDNLYGSLSVSAREITVTAGSKEARLSELNGTPLIFDEYTIESGMFEEPLADGDTATVVLSGAQSKPGSCDNEIVSVTVTNKNGKDVTGNYSVKCVSGRLSVTV